MYVDFSRRQKLYMPVKLSNGMKLDIEEPNMQIFQNLQKIEETKKVKDLVSEVRHIMSRNRQKKKFSNEEIAMMFTVDDMVLLLESYANFARGIQNDPN